ncbi:hypothetical protein ACF0H5_018877 [Mactra antiquata]
MKLFMWKFKLMNRNRMMTSSRVSQQRNLDIGRHCEVPNEILVKTREDEGEKVGHSNDKKQARNRMMTSSRVSQQRNLDIGRHCEVPNEILVKTREDEGEKVGHSNDKKQARWFHHKVVDRKTNTAIPTTLDNLFFVFTTC